MQSCKEKLLNSKWLNINKERAYKKQTAPSAQN